MRHRSGKVGVVYHFFAHYRGAVMRELLDRGAHDYFLVGDTRDPQHSGIVPWDLPGRSRFVHAPARFLPWGGIMVQSGLLRLALRRDVKAIIYLGDPHYASTWISAALARLLGKRVLFWTIGWLRREGGLKDLVRRTFLRIPHGLLLYGHFAKTEAIKKGFAPERLYVVYNSLDYDEQRQIRAAMSPERPAELRRTLSPDGRPLLICVSRLVPKRRLDLLLEAMVLLEREGRPMNLLLVGDGPERARLAEFAERHRLAVQFYGECYDERVLAELLQAADATVAPGMVGLTAMQSLAYCTPVVTHDDFDRQAPEWEAIVPGRSGTFFRFGDSADLARAIRECTATLGWGSPSRRACDGLVERFYNPAYQRRVIDRAVAGEPADDLSWMRDPAGARGNGR